MVHENIVKGVDERVDWVRVHHMAETRPSQAETWSQVGGNNCRVNVKSDEI